MARKIDNRERMAAINLLTANLTIVREIAIDPETKEVTDPGLVKYKPGWSDEVIAGMVADGLSFRSIAGLRCDLFGQLKLPDGSGDQPGGVANYDVAIADLKAANTSLSKTAENLVGLLERERRARAYETQTLRGAITDIAVKYNTLARNLGESGLVVTLPQSWDVPHPVRSAA